MLLNLFSKKSQLFSQSLKFSSIYISKNHKKKWCVIFITMSFLSTTYAAAPPIKAGFIYIGPTNDHGWTYAHDQARIKTEQALKGQIKTSYVESVGESADAERVIRSLIQQGNNVIFTTSFGYMNATEKVAKQFPNATFMHATGYKSAKNMSNYNLKVYQNTYLMGVIAGKTTKTNKIGVVASYPIPEVIRNINAFTIGARSVNPKVTTQVVWANTWYNPGKERDAAMSLIAQKNDVLMQNTDSPAVVQAAESKGVYAFGWDSDMSKFGKKAHLAASVLHWEKIYIKSINDILAKKWTNQPVYYGIKEGAVNVENLGPSVSIETKKIFEARHSALKNGTLHPFAGPLYNQAGQLFVKKGQNYSEDKLNQMNFYVQGVTGAFPK